MQYCVIGWLSLCGEQNFSTHSLSVFYPSCSTAHKHPRQTLALALQGYCQAYHILQR